jgi:hypothetical protein
MQGQAADGGVHAGSATVAWPVDEDEPRNTLPNVERRRAEAYEHASSKLKDVFDAMGLALIQARNGPQPSMDVLTADRSPPDPSVPDAPTGGLGAGRPASLR